MPTYTLLGLGARPVDFEGETWPFRGGHIGWIRFDNGEYPVTWNSSDEIGKFGREPFEDATRWRFAPDHGRFTITTDEDEPAGAELAAAVGDGIAGLVAGAGVPLDPELSITPALENEWLEAGEVRLADLEDRDGWMTPFGLPAHAKGGIWIDPEQHRLIMEWVEPMLRMPDWRTLGPFPAVIYHRQSLSDVRFGPHEVREVIEDREMCPVAPYEAAILERAFHAAFKGIEALLGGEPSKDNRRFDDQLARVGLAPNRDVRLPDHRGEPLNQRIRRLHNLRDTRSAHGGRTRNRSPLRYYDVMEAQWVLPMVITDVIKARLGAHATSATKPKVALAPQTAP